MSNWVSLPILLDVLKREDVDSQVTYEVTEDIAASRGVRYSKQNMLWWAVSDWLRRAELVEAEKYRDRVNTEWAVDALTKVFCEDPQMLLEENYAASVERLYAAYNLRRREEAAKENLRLEEERQKKAAAKQRQRDFIMSL